MFMFLKLIKPFLLPPTLIAGGMALSLWWWQKKKVRSGKFLLLITLLSYYLLSTLPGAYFLVRTLEKNLPEVTGEELAEVEAIVVLAGGALKAGPHRLQPELSGPSWRRLWRGIELYRQLGGRVPLLYSGGSGDPFDRVSIEAELAKDYALSLGVPAPDFWTDSLPRNTHESGHQIKKILERRLPGISSPRIALVTSSLHMPRSLLIMKKTGLRVIPVPTDFPFGSLSLHPLSFLPSAETFSLSSFCIHEWVGIVGSRLLGYG